MSNGSLTPAVGDVVTLISGGPPMTVEKLENAPTPPAGLPPGVSPQLHVHCVWFHRGTGALARSVFSSSVLVAQDESASDDKSYPATQAAPPSTA